MAKDSRKRLQAKLAIKLALQNEIADLEEQVKAEREEFLVEKLQSLGIHKLNDEQLDQLVLSIKTFLKQMSSQEPVAGTPVGPTMFEVMDVIGRAALTEGSGTQPSVSE